MESAIIDNPAWLVAFCTALAILLLAWHNRKLNAQVKELTARLAAQQRSAEDCQRLAAAVEHAAEAIAITDRNGIYQYVNPAFETITGYPASEAIGTAVVAQAGDESDTGIQRQWQMLLAGLNWSGRLTLYRKDGAAYEADQTLSPVRDPHNGKITNAVILTRDVTEHSQLERQLQHAQKLEAIGRLASGIAHEINTPTQYISDNTVFLKRAFTSLVGIVSKIPEVLNQLHTGSCSQDLLVELESRLAAAKLDFLLREVPDALDQSLDGLERVSGIVCAMKEFAHPVAEMTPIDLNHAIQSTTTVARNEWKYVSELDLNLDPDLPPLTCLPGDINQAVLIIVVNAAHAIADSPRHNEGGKGRIEITTRQLDDQVELVIADNGIGMSDAVKAHIFEAFFTTKDVGRGTGQGLNITWDVIVNKHHGRIEVESQPGCGTRFIMHLPLAGNAVIPQQAAA